MKWKNVLLASSVLLNAVLLVSLMMPGRAPDFGTAAFGQNRAVSGGGVTATTANITSSRQGLWVVDSTEKRMVVYAFPGARGKDLDLVGGRDLRKDFGDLAGDVLLLPGQIPGGTEAVYVIDPVGKKIIAYNCRGTGREIDVIGRREMAKDFRE